MVAQCRLSHAGCVASTVVCRLHVRLKITLGGPWVVRSGVTSRPTEVTITIISLLTTI